MTDTTPADPTIDDAAEVIEQKAVRLAKRERLLAERADAAGGAYPVTVPVTDTIAELRERDEGGASDADVRRARRCMDHVERAQVTELTE